MIKQFQQGECVVVRVPLTPANYGGPYIYAIGTIKYAHPKYGWCSCDLGPYTSSYWNERITPLAKFNKPNVRVFELGSFNYIAHKKFILGGPKHSSQRIPLST